MLKHTYALSASFVPLSSRAFKARLTFAHNVSTRHGSDDGELKRYVHGKRWTPRVAAQDTARDAQHAPMLTLSREMNGDLQIKPHLTVT